jgi:hypothetical protein
MIDNEVVRPRQAGILLREVVKYRENLGLSSWPCFLAGGKSRRRALFHLARSPNLTFCQTSTSTPENPDTPSWPETETH